MTEMTRAVVADGAGGPEVLRVVERPRPVPGEGQMLVRVQAAGVNRPDVMQRQGNYPPPPGASDVFGLELAGTVETLGPGVTDFAPGDRVMALVHSGAYADWAVVDAPVTLPVPEGVSLTEAGAIPETYFTVWSNLFERARLTAGETVLIHGGTSGIGTTAIQLAKAFGARVLVTAGSPEKCEAATQVGADHAIDYTATDFVTEARALTDDRGPDVILDMVGGDYVQRNLDLAAVDGRISQIAFQHGSRADLDLQPLLVKRLTLVGSTLRARPVPMKAKLAQALAEWVLPLLARGQAKPRIDSTFPLETVADAHARMDSGTHVGKIVLTMAPAA
ncbi:NAD(P)H-quinone oxidoreductase [Roseospira marina]|uniref:NAD(P)H-quinone oxidoreductase n=1 Tax=Roseospira marina TaxID=140057 RepID=A0A5M6IFT3_9PROT|nr:NAD(P)H-quinone oxidoreductase [Roseospira marina]KAA5606609.1 NAD(P)H-quinone oxidoreductase [Roseospira marina]MBB4313989.1 putative PIG3 family NAD(P)H quinone oxidoreductase [Roseospira marina]MBB5087151.1 putative PIG3 family NAD(P)H quinone oxidoreductase [Roseospira marina]